MKFVFAAIAAAGLATVMTVSAIAGDTADPQKDLSGQAVRDYLLKHPEVLKDALDALQKQEEAKQAEQAKQGIKTNADALLRSPLDFVAGNPNGKVTIVEFFDYNCPYCKRAHHDVVALIDNEKDVRVVFKEFPILGEASTFASRAAIAAKKQGKYLELHNALLSVEGRVDSARVMSLAQAAGLDVERLRKDMQAPNIDEPIKLSHGLAEKLGISGTPTFIIGDQLYPGAVGVPILKQQIASVRQSGCAVC